MLVLHFGSSLGCVEPVLIEWSVSCRGGARRKLNGSDIFRGLLRELRACYHVDTSDMGAFRRAVCIWGRVILSSIPDEVILCVG